MSPGTVVRWTAVAALGIALAVGLALATLQVTSQHVGLSAEPLTEGQSLAPSGRRAAPATTPTTTPAKTTPTRTTTTKTTTSTATTPTLTTTLPTQTPPPPPPTTTSGGRDDSGGRRGGEGADD